MASRPAIGTVGAGRMGRGIALAFAYAGHDIAVIDLKPRDAAATAALEAALHAEIARDLAFLVRVGALAEAEVAEVAAHVQFVAAGDAPAAIAACKTLFEGVPETLDAKRNCLTLLDRHAPAECIIASTTSTMDADTLSAFLATPARFLNAHWLNPAYLMPLVELSPSAVTDPAALAAMRALLTSIGKVPITCRSAPGYIVPRIQALAMNEAARIVEEGIASAEDVDTAVRVGFGLRFAVLGLLEFIDWGGGDILHHASSFLSANLDPQRFAAPAIIDRNMREGRNGLRDGRGFYNYDGVDLDAYRENRLEAFVALLRHRDLMPRRTAPKVQTKPNA